MKKTLTPLITAALFAALTGSVAAADNGHSSHAGHGSAQAKPAADAALTEGQVKKVDKAAGRITISHGPLPNGMPAMTMALPVKDAAWLTKAQAGQKVRFAVEDIKGVLTLVRLEIAG